mgnify:CR=1 FL=1
MSRLWRDWTQMLLKCHTLRWLHVQYWVLTNWHKTNSRNGINIFKFDFQIWDCVVVIPQLRGWKIQKNERGSGSPSYLITLIIQLSHFLSLDFKDLCFIIVSKLAMIIKNNSHRTNLYDTATGKWNVFLLSNPFTPWFLISEDLLLLMASQKNFSRLTMANFSLNTCPCKLH